jgi:hypothetical protein
MSDLTPEELREAIKPKSDQLNANDLLLGPITVTIMGVKRGNKEQPVVVEIEGHKPWKPCVTMSRILATAFQGLPQGWIGQRVTLYRDPEAMFGGHKVGGIRISHLSGLDGPTTYTVTDSRIKTSQVTIYPIDETLEQKPTDEEQEFIAEATREIAVADLETLKGYGEIIKGKSQAIRNALRPVYEERLEELKA